MHKYKNIYVKKFIKPAKTVALRKKYNKISKRPSSSQIVPLNVFIVPINVIKTYFHRTYTLLVLYLAIIDYAHFQRAVLELAQRNVVLHYFMKYWIGPVEQSLHFFFGHFRGVRPQVALDVRPERGRLIRQVATLQTIHVEFALFKLELDLYLTLDVGRRRVTDGPVKKALRRLEALLV